MSIQSRLKEHVTGSFTANSNLHLTLVFLGEIEQSDLPTLKSAISQVCVPKMKLIFGYTGVFKRKDGDIWWIGIESNPHLIRLQKELAQSLRNAGFPVENRPYKPHITLVRRAESYKKFDKNILLNSSFAADADKISLMLSQTTSGKPFYSELYSVRSSKSLL